MDIWLMMFGTAILIPVIMIIFGALFKDGGPGTINDLYGYRTRMSKLNYSTWNFAHKELGRLWLRDGLILLGISIVIMLPIINKDEDFVAIVGGVLSLVQCIPLLVDCVLVERALRKTFDKEGNRIEE